MEGGNRKFKAAALFSGGKDSTFAVVKAIEAGHTVACLVSIRPASDASMLFHYPNTRLAKYQAEAMGIPLLEYFAQDDSTGGEEAILANAIKEAVSAYGVGALVHGGISSEFQKRAFTRACNTAGIELISPLWHYDPASYMSDLVDRGFEIIVVAVSAMGLDDSWLGRRLDKEAVGSLIGLSARFGFNLNFEGGEAETLVTDCPLFRKKLVVRRASKHWDGQRGMFEIQEVELIDKGDLEANRNV